MDIYNQLSETFSRILTQRYSSSFGLSSALFPLDFRGDIYNIYGLVRIADEIVDEYRGPKTLQLLDELEQDVYRALTIGFSANLIVQAFQKTARKFGIDRKLIGPFFASMRMDITAQRFDAKTYQAYIHGSAEVVGLMCLKVFIANDPALYKARAAGAARLGAAYQKINFLRDLAADYNDMQRFYFPGTTMEAFDEVAKIAVLGDIQADFAVALPEIQRLPASSRPAVMTSYVYYSKLAEYLERTPVEELKQRRVRISNAHKLWLLARTATTEKLRRSK